ncbi:hypothetical protein [Streptomyces cylindrosporus]|uniref:Uncharacterized protein n=1 Tax=Streptomyces cylindrosporus TaxID=2927583 RepID=A0ABS9Y2I8_9ACTN|nr:hypothetical protein [Streptomyces cylindrosporus]MCI3271413.1 hypothetical protein [Streptomyces cylindrosporus]
MSLRDIARSLRPGNDQQLATDLSTQRRQGHHRSVGKAAAEGQAWEDRDRKLDRLGDRQTDWDD